MLLLRMAWRNIFRNKRRTLLTAAIIGMGLASLILTDAIIQGLVKNMTSSATDTFLGQAQVHAERFRLEGGVEQTVVNLPAVEAVLGRDATVSSFSERTRSLAMGASTSDAESMLLYGIDPQKEERVTLLHKVILQGRNLSDPDEVGILLGDLLAKKLQAKVGDRIVVTCTKAGTGELSQEMLRVIGLFSFRSREMDGHMAFIGLRRARKMMGLGSEAHEVVLRFKDGDGSEPSHEALYRLLSLGGNEALDWSKLLPDVKVVLDYSAYVAWILVFLLAALVALAILNTQFMALYERMFEFGVLRALGTHPLHLGGLVVLEASSLGFLGVLLGLALGYLITSVMGHIGFNYTGIEYAGVVFQEAIYPETRALQYTLMPFAVWVFTMLVACYPASHACRILPAKAMHRSLG